MESNASPQANIRLTRLLIIALLTAAVIFIFRQVSEAIARFTTIILLFGISWLFAFLISPITNYLSRHPVPPFAVRYVRQRGQAKWAARLDSFRVPHALAVISVYLVVLFVLALASIYAIPALVGQLIALGQYVPKFIETLPGMLATIQEDLARRGIALELATMYEPTQLAKRAEAISSQIIQTALTLATSLASALMNALLVLTLSFYMNLDGPRLARQLHAIIPDHYHGRVNLIGQSLARTFGGFMRGQLLIALLYGVPATVLMAAVGIGLAAVMGTISGLLMLIPLVGAPIAMVLPALIALVQSPQDALWLLIVMTVYQQVLTQILAPRIMADVLGMPPLLVMLAIMMSMRLIGVWGLVFGIPLAGVVYALTVAYLEQSKIRRDSLPQGLSDGDSGSVFRLAAMGPGCLFVPDIESPAGELRALAQHLASRGITTLGIEPYRGQSQVYWEDWYAAVLPALDQLWRDCNRVFVVGKGVGALLALHAASELPVAGVCAIALPLTREGRYASHERHAVAPDGPTPASLLATRVGPANVKGAVSHLQERVHAELSHVVSPVLLVHPSDSAGITPEDTRYVLERLGTTNKRIEWMDSDSAGEGNNAERVGQIAFSFFRNVLQ